MKNIFKALSFVVLAILFAGCPKDDSITIEPPRPFAEQKPIDEAAIDDFLATHFVTIDADYNTTFTLIEDGGTETPIKDMPNLTFKTVERNDLTYKLYYLMLNEGDVVEGINPIKVDSVFVAYKGSLLDGTIFDQQTAPVWFGLDNVIPGWAEIVPNFKTGKTNFDPATGEISYSDFGAGVMFLPSSFGYYNETRGLIPSYAPLIFNFKLVGQKYRDHDLDRILTVHEYYDSSGSIMDTDGDGAPNYLDVDDDGDGILTKEEIKFSYVNSVGVTKYEYYQFNGAAVDNPLTPYDETKGIPSCSGDFTTATRLRKHLDPSCQ